MTKKEKEIIRLVVDFALCDDEPSIISNYPVSLKDAYQSYSCAKESAYWRNADCFDKDIKGLKSHSDFVVWNFRRIMSHNCMFFSMLQGAYFSNGAAIYAIYRYDTASKTIEGCFKYSKAKNSYEAYKSVDDMFKKNK